MEPQSCRALLRQKRFEIHGSAAGQMQKKYVSNNNLYADDMKSK